MNGIISASSQFSAKALTAPIFVPNAGGNSFTLDPLARTDVATTRGAVYWMGVEAQEFIPRQSTTLVIYFNRVTPYLRS